MGLMKCPACAKEFNDELQRCSHCGYNRRPRSYVVEIASAAILLLVVALCALVNRSGSRTEIDSKGDDVSAALACQEFVKARLKAPTTADFPLPYKAPLTTRSGVTGGWRWSAYVDAQNAFGAMIRTRFVCDVHKVAGDDTYLLDSITLDEN